VARPRARDDREFDKEVTKVPSRHKNKSTRVPGVGGLLSHALLDEILLERFDLRSKPA
jgi:hypothetical protein